jgi:hypothetical protein
MSATAQIKKNFIVPISCEPTFVKLQSTLPTLGLKNLKTKKAIPCSYLLVEYKEGFMQKGEIEFYVIAKKSKTEISLAWTYPSNEEEETKDEGDFEEGAEILYMIFSNVKKIGKSKLNYDKLIEELRLKMNSAENPSIEDGAFNSKDSSITVMNIRCRACCEVFDGRLGKCPRCGKAGYF